jgi:hypothetical protein
MHGKHRHHHGNGHHHHDRDHDHGPGHNHATPPKTPAQWQTPHLPQGAPQFEAGEPDADLMEAAFIEGFASASDPTSFLRLAQVPFEGVAPDGKRLVLLRVESDAVTDLGAITPHLGGGTFRYDPLPARMVSRRVRARMVYFDGEKPRSLSLQDAKNLGKP